jgi:hypothetical protein
MQCSLYSIPEAVVHSLYESDNAWSINFTEHRVIAIITSTSYAGCPGFDSWLGNQLFRLKTSMIFFSPFRWMLGQYITINHKQILLSSLFLIVF